MDEIQLRLQQIDSDLQQEVVLPRCPLLLVALSLIAGILLQMYFNIPLPYLLTAAAIIPIAALIIYKRPTQKYTLALIITAAILSAATLGMIRLSIFNHIPQDSLINSITDTPTLATIKARILTQPIIKENKNWHFRNLTYKKPSTTFYAKVDQVQTPLGWQKTNSRIYVTIAQPAPNFNPSDYIQIHCLLSRFTPPDNPGQFDIKTYMAGKKVFLSAYVKSPHAITLIKRQASQTKKLQNKITALINNAILPDSPQQPSDIALLQALFLGQRHNIDQQTYIAFRQTGLLHFISLSGMHFGILIAIIWWLCKTAGLLRPTRAIVCIIATAIFLLVVPPRPPTIRAAIICWMFCLSFIFARTHNAYNSLSLAAIILLLINPADLTNAGFQLSFTCVLGILIFSPRLQSFLRYKLIKPAFDHLPPNSPLTKLLKRIIKYSCTMFAASLSAFIAAAPIMLYHFKTIQPFAPLWTVLLFPLISIILTFGFAKIIIFFLLPTLANILQSILQLLSDITIAMVNFIAHLNIPAILIGKTSVLIIIFYCTFILFARYAKLSSFKLKQTMIKFSAALIIISLIFTKYHNTHPNALTLHILSVGHGQSLILQTPNAKTILFDCGSKNLTNIGNKIVTPFLDLHAINAIDIAIISHDDIDHLNGICEVAQQKNITSLLSTQSFINAAQTSDSAKTIATFFKSNKNMDIEICPQNIPLSRDINIKKLWPIESTHSTQNLHDNDSSIVSLLTCKNKNILITGDITQNIQQQLISLYPNLRADILIAPHHGSLNTINTNFLKHISPETIISSCGRSQYQKNRIIHQFENAQMLHTSLSGQITVTISEDQQINIKTFKTN